MNKKTFFSAIAVLLVGIVFAESDLIKNYLKSEDEPTTFKYNGLFYKVIDNNSVWVTHGTLTKKFRSSYDYDYFNYVQDYDYTDYSDEYETYNYWNWEYYNWRNDNNSEYFYQDYVSPLYRNEYQYARDDYWFDYYLNNDYFYDYNTLYNFYGGDNEKTPSGNIVIPETVKFEGKEYIVTGISSHAFSQYFSYDMTKGCNITSIVIPQGIKTIAYDAFEGCTELKSITWNAIACNELSDIFAYSNNSVKSVNFGNAVEHIPSELCYGMKYLKEITIPASVKSIGYYAFSECKNLAQIICNAQEPPIMVRNSFSKYDATVKVPCEYKSNYLSDNIWGAFQQIQCDEAEEVSLDSEEVVVEEETFSVEIAFPKVENANTYILTVKNNGNVVCQLEFNENGVLLNIVLKNETIGFKYKIDGLEAGTKYTYEIQAQDQSKNVLKTFEGSFSTKENNVGIDNVTTDYSLTVVNRTIHILPDNNTSVAVYDIQGKCIYHSNNTSKAVVTTPKAGVYVVKIGKEQQVVVVK